MTPKKKHVLIVEDDRLLAGLLRDTFEEHGATVTNADSGKPAKMALDKEKIDLVLLDLLMPDVDGFAVLEYAREHHRSLPIVVLSNLGDKKSRDRCRSLGCKGYLVKSDLDDDDIWSMVSKYIG